MADNSPISTNLPLLTAGMGEEITSTDQQINEDFNTLSPASFRAKYGNQVADSMNSQAAALRTAVYDAMASQQRTPGEFIADSAKNILTGAATGLTGAGSMLSGLLGADAVSESLARATNSIQKFSEEHGSLAEQSQRRDFATRQQALGNRLDREYQENIRDGMSDAEASFRRYGKEFFNTLGNLAQSGQITNLGAEGVGSIISGGIETKAITGAGALASKALPKVAERAMDAYSKANPITKKIADASPWMASMGLQEGGSQYSQVLLEGLDTPIEDLYTNSPAFVRSVKEHMIDGMSQKDAETEARRDMANAAAREAGIETGIAAGIANYMTAGLVRPFSRMGKTTGKYMSEALSEPVEEALSEGAGTLATNLATQRYLNQNQEITEGLGENMAQGFAGGLGIVGTRAVNPKTMLDAAVLGAQGLRAASGLAAEGARQTRDFYRENVSESQEAINNRIQNINRQSENLEQLIPNSETDRTIHDVNKDLKTVADEIFSTTTDEASGKEVSALTLDKAFEIESKLNNDDALVANTSGSEESNLKEVNNAKRQTREIIKRLEHNIDRRISKNIDNQRASYSEGTALTQEQIDAEGTYFATMDMIDSNKASQLFSQLPQSRQEELKTAQFSAPKIQEAMQKFLNIKPEQSTKTSEPETESAEEVNIPIEVSATSTAEDTARIYNKPFISQEEANQASTLQADTPLENGYSFQEYSDGSKAFAKDNRVYKLTPKQISRITDAAPEEQQNVFNQVRDEVIATDTTLQLPHFVLSQGQNGRSVFKLTPEGELINARNNEVVSIPDEVTSILKDSSKTNEEKAKILQEYFNRDVEESTRRARSLSPTVLEKQNKYLEDGQVKDYASEDIKESFSKTFGDKVTSLVTPVKRAIYLWQSESPIQVFMDAFNSKESVLNYLRMNQFTNASTLTDALFDLNGEALDSADPKRVLMPNDTLINQILTMVNPQGVYMQRFMEHADFALKDNMPQAFKDAFYKDGKPDPRIKEIAAIASVHWLSTLSAYQHELNKDELEKHGIDPNVQEKDFSTLGGVIEPMAIQSLATTLRKMMGVSINNNAKIGDYEDFFYTLAVETATVMQNAGLIEVSDLNYNLPTTDRTKHEQAQMKMFSPSESYKSLFRPKATVMLSLIDPTFKNAWSTQELPAKKTISGTSIPISDAQEKTIQNENKKSASINTYLWNFVEAIGGQFGLTNLFSSLATDDNRNLSNINDFRSRKGQQLTQRLAFDFMREVLAENKDISPEDLKIFFSTVALKNGRFMMEGAATPQSNKLLRQFLNYMDKQSHDLTDPEAFNAWKLTLAQKLGISVNKKAFKTYSSIINDALDFVKNASVSRAAQEEVWKQEETRLKNNLEKLNRFIELKEKHPTDTRSPLDMEILEYFRTQTQAGKDGLYDNWTWVGYEQYFKEALAKEKALTEQLLKLGPNMKKVDNAKVLASLTQKASDLSEEQIEIRNLVLKSFIQEFNNRFKNLGRDQDISLAIRDEESLNALLEMLRYAQASKTDLQKFDSRIFLEIDGTNDGPSNINSMYTIAMNHFTPRYMLNNYKTGNHFGLEVSSQDTMTPGSTAAKTTGTNGEDMHAEVAQRAIISKFLERLIANNKDRNNGNKNSEEAVRQTINLLKLFKAVGWIDGEINESVLKSMTSMPKEMPFTFKRDISKKLTTVIPYGSEPRGSTEQIISLMMDEIYSKISKTITDSVNDPNTLDKNNAELAAIMKPLKELLSVKYYPKSGFSWLAGNKFDDLVYGYSETIPDYMELFDSAWQTRTGSGLLYKKGDPSAGRQDIRNFMLTREGQNNLVDVATALFGEPAHAAVNEVMGTDGMRGARIPTLLSGVLTTITRAMEQKQIEQVKGLRNLTANQLYQFYRKLNRAAPIFRFNSGAQTFVRKTRFAQDNRTIYTNSASGISAHSLTSSIASAGVSGGALATQAMGDASMIMYASDAIAEAGLNPLQVYDGVYVGIDSIAQLGEILNKASNEAQRQKVMKSLVHRIEQVGEFLKDQSLNKRVRQGKNGKQTVETFDDPFDIVINAASNIAAGLYLDGTSYNNQNLLSADVQRDIRSLVEKVNQNSKFEPSLAEIYKNARQKKDVTYSTPLEAYAFVSDNLTRVKKQLQVIVLNEQIQHRVVNSIPKTTHHMSGSESFFTQGIPLSPTAANKLVEEVNNGTQKYRNFEELMRAYMNKLAEKFFEEYKAKAEPPISAELERNWRNLTGRDKGNSGYVAVTNTEFELIAKRLGSVGGVHTVNQNNHLGSTELRARDIRNVFAHYGNMTNANSIFNNLYKKVAALLPEDAKVTLVGSRDALPKNIQKMFANNTQKGIYTTINGVPEIYVIDSGSQLNIYDLRNAEILLHECIHAALSTQIVKYYDDPNSLRKDQREAIENLEALLSDFLDTYAWQGDLVPTHITELRKLLSEIENPAERLDESLAYILSNHNLFEEFAQYALTQPEPHASRFGRLLHRITQAANRVWRKLLNIVTGSPMDEALSWEDTVDHLNKKPLDFLSLYGANTLVLLNATEQLTPRDREEERQRISGISRAFRDPVLGSTFQKDLSTAIIERLKTEDVYKQTPKFRDRSAYLNGEHQRQLAKSQQWKSTLYDLTKNIISNADDFVKSAEYFARRDVISPTQKLNLQIAYTNLAENISEDFLVQDKANATQEELEASKKIYDLIQGDSPLFSRRDLPEIFDPKFINAAITFSLALNSPEVNAALGKIKFSDSKDAKHISDPVGWMETTGKELVDKWAKEASDNKSAQDVAHVAMEEADSASQSMAQQIHNGAENLFYHIDSGFIGGIAKTLSFLGMPDRSATVQTILDAPITGYNVAMEGIRNLANKTKNTLFTDFLYDVYGRTPSRSEAEGMLKERKGYFDRVRSQFLDEFPELCVKLFKKTEVTPLFRQFLHKAVGRVNLTTLTNAEAQAALTDTQKNQELIAQYEEQLTSQSPDFAQKYFKKIKQLANYLTGDRKAGRNLLRNQYAISRLLGETEFLSVMATQETVDTIAKLITLYSIKNFSEAERTRLSQVFKDDGEAMNILLDQLHQVYEDEQKKVDVMGHTQHINNFLFGSLPKGETPTGHYIIVPKSKEKSFIGKGYKTLGIYDKSNADPSDPMVRMYNAYPPDKEYQEGILQSIHTTAFGYRMDQKSAHEADGTLIDPKHFESIFNRLQNETSDNGVIPIYDETGYAIGFERAISPEDRNLIEDSSDLFSGMAQWKSRQFREVLADSMNHIAIIAAAEEYNNASDEEKKSQYIDVLHSTNPIIQEGIRRLSKTTRDMIRKNFGDHFYLKTDMVNTYLGHSRLSIDDLWEGKTLLSSRTEKALVKCLENVFGPRSRYYMNLAEKGYMSFISFVRDTIVIRSGVVAFVNALANTMNLHLVLGVPLQDIARYYKETWAHTQTYNKLAKKIHDLEFQLASASPTEKAVIKKRIKHLTGIIENLPIYRLIKDGEYSTISPEGAIYENVDIFKGKLDDNINTLVDKVAGGRAAKDIARNILMTKGSTSYKTMAEFINMGDWMAKVAGYRYLTERSTKDPKKLLYPHEQARAMVSTLFVDYDQMTGREREWLNRMGLTWFMTYKWRMIPAAIMSAFFNPSRVLLGSILASQAPISLGTPFDENILAKILSGDISYSIGLDMILRGLALHPAAVITGLSE